MRSDVLLLALCKVDGAWRSVESLTDAEVTAALDAIEAGAIDDATFEAGLLLTGDPLTARAIVETAAVGARALGRLLAWGRAVSVAPLVMAVTS